MPKNDKHKKPEKPKHDKGHGGYDGHDRHHGHGYDGPPHYHPDCPPIEPCPDCPPVPPIDKYDRDANRIEAVTVSVGFDDILDYAIEHNHPHVDTLIVVTSHDDHKTRLVCQKHGVICVPTDLIHKNGRNFNKGAAINAGFNRFQFSGVRMHIDSDCLLPDNFRRLLFNHTCLKRDFIYGADRIDIVGSTAADAVKLFRQHNWGYLIYSESDKKLSARYVDGLVGYAPIGFFQLWHASKQTFYPHSNGSAAHDDIAFSTLWPECNRALLPSVICHHLVADANLKFGANWDGRKQKRLDAK